MAHKAPPVAPRNALHSWKQVTPGSNPCNDSVSDDGSNSMSLEESIARKSTHNPLQFVKVHSPPYKKVDQQIKHSSEEVKVIKEAFKENEEEWQSKLDDWKSRRRKSSEKFPLRDEEIWLSENVSDGNKKKIKKFSEIIGKKASRSYNLNLYIDGKEDDETYEASHEPEDLLNSKISITPKNSEEREAESLKSEKCPPKVPKKPCLKLKKSLSIDESSSHFNSGQDLHHCLTRLNSCEEEYHSRITSKEDDLQIIYKTDYSVERPCDNRKTDNSTNVLAETCIELKEERTPIQDKVTNNQVSNGLNELDEKNKELEFTINGAKEECNTAFVDNIISDHVNTELKITESRKGKSFAEKLAIFTSGVNTPTVFEGPKAESAKANKESLVLRRRSAFENRKCENVELEKRHSVDFAFDQNTSSNKKGPPPPVPVKPKVKSKAAYEPNKPLQNCLENMLSFSDCKISTTEHPSTTLQSEILNLNNKICQTNIELGVDESSDIEKGNLVDSAYVEQSFMESEISCKTNCSSSYENQENNVADSNHKDYDKENYQVGDETTDQHFASFEANEHEDHLNEFGLDTIKEDQSLFYNKENAVHEQYEDSNEINPNISACSDQKESAVEMCNDFENKQSNTDNQVDDSSLGDSSENETNLVPSACRSLWDGKNVNNSHVTESFETVESKTTESKVGTLTNSSPLCLSLEKIDEDDVISASTTTSSDTPDTETVIETLPSTFSPLPNDESNGEDSSKLPNLLAVEPVSVSKTNEVSSSEPNDESENTNLYEDKGAESEKSGETFDDMLNHHDRPVDAKIAELPKTYSNGKEDDDYVCELEESLDKITSLDIIDRIEQSLMDQLQQENVEDLTQNLTDYSEGMKAPPNHPPPPPPLEPSDEYSIKKELWRMRSNFLGLNISEIDMYDIPPPPPGLEELLKLEREQTQWLEKKLAMVESEMPYSADSGEFSNNDYLAEESAESENWMPQVEESLFNVSYDSQYESPPETPSTIIEEKTEYKSRQNIQNLGAAPKAKIMDSTQWITEKSALEPKKMVESQPVSNTNYWISQDEEWLRCNPAYSQTHPDISDRLWQYEYQLNRPNYYKSGYIAEDENLRNKDFMHTQSIDAHLEIDTDTDILESEVHNCSCCGKGLCEGSAMGIEALRLYFHIECFRCCLCNMQLGNGSCGTDVQVKDDQLYCPSCFLIG